MHYVSAALNNCFFHLNVLFNNLEKVQVPTVADTGQAIGIK